MHAARADNQRAARMRESVIPGLIPSRYIKLLELAIYIYHNRLDSAADCFYCSLLIAFLLFEMRLSTQHLAKTTDGQFDIAKYTH